MLNVICWPWLFQTTVCIATVRRTAKMSELAKSTIGYVSNSLAQFKHLNLRYGLHDVIIMFDDNTVVRSRQDV